MIFIRSRGGACVTLIALSMLAASSQVVRADTTTLICHMNDNKFWVEEGPTTIQLNEAQSTVVAINYSKVHGAPGSGICCGSTGGLSYGPFPATFSADTITWQSAESGIESKCAINRLTGIFACQTLLNGRWADNAANYTCNAAQKRF
jgi:hypothetical protein